MKLKVCGLNNPKNLQAVAELAPDYLGFIFYGGSPRCARVPEIQAAVLSLPSEIQKVGVFVNQELDEVLTIGKALQLDFMQLHGHESPAYVQAVNAAGFGVIKAFAVRQGFDWGMLNNYVPKVDFFLFDTPTPGFGGSGQTFDWTLLNHYQGTTPFFLSGGLEASSMPAVKSIQHPAFYGLDANSRLETAPGHKDLNATQQLINAIKQ